jgi:hypothetical protein
LIFLYDYGSIRLLPLVNAKIYDDERLILIDVWNGRHCVYRRENVDVVVVNGRFSIVEPVNIDRHDRALSHDLFHDHDTSHSGATWTTAEVVASICSL